MNVGQINRVIAEAALSKKPLKLTLKRVHASSVRAMDLAKLRSFGYIEMSDREYARTISWGCWALSSQRPASDCGIVFLPLKPLLTLDFAERFRDFIEELTFVQFSIH